MHFLINIYWIGLGFIISVNYSKWYQSELKENDNNVRELHENNQLRLTTTSDITNDVNEFDGNIIKDTISICNDDNATEFDKESGFITINFHLQNQNLVNKNN